MVILVAWRFLASQAPGNLLALAVAGASGVAPMSATNFLLHPDFRWLLLIPVLLWLAGLVCYLREGAAGAVAAK